MKVVYKDFDICYNIYKCREWTVQYCGDDYRFLTLEDAKRFVDEKNELIKFNRKIMSL